MAVGQGFSKAVTNGSVFWYDTGDMINSFKGKPGTNSLDGVIRNYNGAGQETYSNGILTVSVYPFHLNNFPLL